MTRLSAQISALVRGELELAKTELVQKGKRAGIGAGLAGGAGLLSAFAVGILLVAAVAALALVWPVWLAALVVGAVVLLLAAGLALYGRSQIRRATPIVPEQAAHSIQDDITEVRKAAHR